MIRGIAETWQRHSDEAASWVEPDALARGEGGPFDGLDLRHWLALAQRAGVLLVPAREIPRLEEHEFSALSGEVNLPNTAVTRRLTRMPNSLP